MRNTFHIQHSKDGFAVVLLKESWRTPVADFLDTIICRPFNHSLPGQWYVCNALSNWAWRGEKEYVTIPISYEEAVAASDPGVWDWTQEKD